MTKISIWCNVNFESVFTVINNAKKQTFNEHGNNFHYLTSRDKLKIWRITFLKSFYTTEKLWEGLPDFSLFSRNSGFMTCTCI